MFLGWDGLGISSFVLVIFFKNWITLNNRIITFIRNRIGDSIFLIIFSYLIFSSSFIILRVSILFCFLGSTKSAQFPFISWLPAAIAAPTPVSALVHSSTLVTAGRFIILIFINNIFLFNIKYLILISLITIMGAGLSAFLEADFKKMVAFSTLSQVGFLFFILSNNKFLLILLHLFSHAFFKRILFVGVGGLLHRSLGNQESRSNKKIINFNLSCYLLILLRILNLMGLLFIRGFWSKDIFLIYISNNKNIFSFNFMLIILISFTWIYNIKIIYFLINFNKNFKKELSYSLNFSILLLFILSIYFSINFLENYLFLYEFNLFSTENYLFIIFLIFSFILLNIFIKINYFIFIIKILNLINISNLFIFIFQSFYKKIEKKIIDNVIIKTKFFFLIKKFIFYFYSFIVIIFLFI